MRPPHPFPVNKKPPKVGETQSPYTAKKAVVKAVASPKTGSISTDDAAFKRVTDKIFAERKELLRKLAQ